MSEIQTIDVTALDRAESIKSGDALLVVRQNEDGTQTCMRTEAGAFAGEDAYDVAWRNGYAGTYEEWVAQVARASVANVGIDADTGEIVITY